MLKINYARQHRSANGNTVFVYTVSGNAEELEAYKASQGKYYREDDKTGDVLFFTVNYAGPSTSLIITSTGKAIADMSAFEQASSLAKQFDGPLGQEIAKLQAQQLLGMKPSMPASTPTESAPVENVEEDLGNL